jgi:hypothetical protein
MGMDIEQLHGCSGLSTRLEPLIRQHLCGFDGCVHTPAGNPNRGAACSGPAICIVTRQSPKCSPTQAVLGRWPTLPLRRNTSA